MDALERYRRELHERLQQELMALIARSYQWIPNPDGTLDGAFPDGDKNPQVATLAWGDLTSIAAAIANTATGSSLSVNVRAALTGSAAATATIGVQTVSGSDVTTTGFNQPGSGDNLTNSSGTAGAGSLRLSATTGGNTVLSDPIPWARVQAAATDSIAPTIPTGVTATLSGSDIIVTGDPISDPYVSGETITGVQRIRVRRNGSHLAYVNVSTGISPQLTLYSIGTADGTPTLQQSGKTYTITGACAGGFRTATDQGQFAAAAISGDFTAIVNLDTHANTFSQVSHFGLMARSSVTDASAPAFFIWQAPTNSTNGSSMQASYRLSQGVGYTAGSAFSGLFVPRKLRLKRVGDAFTASYWDTTSKAWITPGDWTATIPMGATCYVGIPHASRSAGNALASIFKDFMLSQSAGWTYTDTNPGAGTFSYTAAGQDIQANESSQSETTADVTINPPSGANDYIDIDFSDGQRPSNAAIHVQPASAADTGALMTVQSLIKPAGFAFASKIDIDYNHASKPFRAEYIPNSDPRDIERRATRHQGYRVYIYWPSAYYGTANPIWQTNLQWHYIQVSQGTPPLDTYNNEPMMLWLENGVLSLETHYNHHIPGHPVTNSDPDRGGQSFVLGTLRTGGTIALDTWHRFDFHAVFDSKPFNQGGTGYLECWMDSVKKIGPGTSLNSGGSIRLGIYEDKTWDQQTISPASSPYVKFGVYTGVNGAGSPPTPGITRQIIYHAGYKHTSGTSFSLSDLT